jgi:hypothetical protein
MSEHIQAFAAFSHFILYSRRSEEGIECNCGGPWAAPPPNPQVDLLAVWAEPGAGSSELTHPRKFFRLFKRLPDHLKSESKAYAAKSRSNPFFGVLRHVMLCEISPG